MTNFKKRYVSEHGETLIVREICGIKVLTDPCDQNVTVVVPSGRRANLVRFAFNGFKGSCSRDAYVAVTHNKYGVTFTAVRYPSVSVYLHELCEGQRVDVLPAAEPLSAYAVVIRPLPVLYGAATAQPNHYAAVAA